MTKPLYKCEGLSRLKVLGPALAGKVVIVTLSQIAGSRIASRIREMAIHIALPSIGTCTHLSLFRRGKSSLKKVMG